MQPTRNERASGIAGCVEHEDGEADQLLVLVRTRQKIQACCTGFQTHDLCDQQAKAKQRMQEIVDGRHRGAAVGCRCTAQYSEV